MNDPAQALIDQALDKLKGIDEQIKPLLAEQMELRATVNGICKMTGRQPIFSGAVHSTESALQSAAPVVLSPDMFTGAALAPAAKGALDLLRQQAGSTTRPATVEEIHTVLVNGGFEFPSRDVENQRRGLAVSLSKSSYMFRKLPNGMFGLTEWYPGSKKPTRKRGDTESAADEAEDAAGDTAADLKEFGFEEGKE